MQRRWFLSYHSPDRLIAERLKSAIECKDPTSHIFFAPTNLRGGGFWSNQLAKEISDATAFVLIVGEAGVGPWQVLEYDEALDKSVNQTAFPLILLLLDGQTAPGLPFLRRFHWIVTKDPSSERTLGQLFDATPESSSRPTELWRYTNPYRGLAAMVSKDSDYFFGREIETCTVVRAFAQQPGRIPILLGNSGVGKSSLAQAGVLAALMRQAWPDAAHISEPWPATFHGSRRWLFLNFRPGPDPINALVEVFLDTWQLESTGTSWPERVADWTAALRRGRLSIRDLLDQTTRRYIELGQPVPSKFMIYIDQGEELYVRADKEQQRSFSYLLNAATSDERLHLMMSMRSDFLGDLQKDEALYNAHIQINVPPLREQQLQQVITKPAALLSARFESLDLPGLIARQAAEEAAKDAGALPLLSYLLDDMWRRMAERGDAILRLPAQAIDLGKVLVDRANSFVAGHPASEQLLKRIFTLKLATVREDGEPTRRRASRDEFSDEEWQLVVELSDHPNRLLITATPDLSQEEPSVNERRISRPHETYAEVAHEAIFRRWDKLRSWIASEREFLAWRSGLEVTRRLWENTSDNKRDALLMGLPLQQARTWLASRSGDIPARDKEFVELSLQSMRSQRMKIRAMIFVPALVLLCGILAIWQGRWISETAYKLTQVQPYSEKKITELPPLTPFRDCTNCPELALISPGKYLRGSPEGQGQPKLPREWPQREVTIAYSFAVGVYEVTFDEWDTCAKYGLCSQKISSGEWGHGRQPVINVTWNDAQHYVAWLSRITGKRYRLLTEAEWEYAARAGKSTLYSFGNDDEKLLKRYAWFAGNAVGGPHPVGKLLPNQFGLFDMHGNVSEWVEDCFHEGYDNLPVNGVAWTGDNCGRRVTRGGSWRYKPSALRSASRDWSEIDKGDDDIGFRVARDLSP